ncbi:MAG: TetR family transcriptional regulator [Thermoleophilaceae bacterium]|nr:TetR family transcriptional regulator [Thermoleophilaceae bacterium]
MTGLRERKKQRNRDAIARAALRLFDRQGFHQTTIPQIAEAADVSPRTVSMHFPAKEELVFPHREEELERLTERVRGRTLDETAPEALRAWVEAELPGWEERHAEHDVQRRVVERDEHLKAYARGHLGRIHDLMAQEIARDLGTPPDAPEPHMAAAATSAVLEVLEHHTHDRGGDVATRKAEALALLDKATAFVSAGIRELQQSATPNG